MEPFELLRPTTVSEVLEALSPGDAVLLGGGTSLVTMVKQHLMTPRRVVWLGRVSELQHQTDQDGRLTLGAGLTLTQIHTDPVVRERYPVLAEVAGTIANPRVRAVATVGGNLVHADPSQDLPPVLLALGATAVVEGPQGERRISLTEFFVDYFTTAIAEDEVVRGVEIPHPDAGQRTQYLRYSPRSQDDFPTVGAAASVTLDDAGRVKRWAVALSGVGPTPVWVEPDETLLGVQPDAAWREAVAERAVAAADPWDDLRGSAEYKLSMTRLFTKRALAGVSA